MNLYFRLLWLWLANRRQPDVHGLAASRLALRVLPGDIDLFGHVNNGRYLTLMDLGRLHVAMRSGLFRVMRRRGWHAAASAVEIRFRRPLKLWRRFVLVTEIADWDADWFVFEQRFESAAKVHARALVQVQFRRGRERVPTAEALAAVGAGALRPPGGGRMVDRTAAGARVED